MVVRWSDSYLNWMIDLEDKVKNSQNRKLRFHKSRAAEIAERVGLKTLNVVTCRDCGATYDLWKDSAVTNIFVHAIEGHPNLVVRGAVLFSPTEIFYCIVGLGI